MRPSVLILLLSTTVVLACWLVELAEVCHTFLFPQLRAQAAVVERIRQRRDDFYPRVEEVSRRVAQGRMSLRDATAMLCAEAAQRHPAYLANLDYLPWPGNVQAKLARNLLTDLEKHGAFSSETTPDVYEQRQREYQEMLADDE